MDLLKETPLASRHRALGAKMVGFAGWSMPVEYEGLRQEHLNVREKVGIFDVSHMGEIRLKGVHSLETLEWLTTNAVAKLNSGQAQYSLLTNVSGGIVDDLIVYCLEKGRDYLLCVNAANTEKDLRWIQENNRRADIIDESPLWGQIAIQGPHARILVARLFGESVLDVPRFHFTLTTLFRDRPVYLARTGYTGEDGFEIFVNHEDTGELWDLLMEQGKELGVQPIGLGARDTLRTEMKYPLYGHEIDDTINPYAAGLGWVVKPDNKDFIGKEKILANKKEGFSQKLVGFKMQEKGIARQGYHLFSFDNKEIGRVTSGTVSPSLNENIGIAYIDKYDAELGAIIFVDIRGRRIKAQVVSTPFVRSGV